MNNTVKNRLGFIISMTIICVAAVFLILASILAYRPVEVVKANVQPYKVATPVVQAGENLIYIADVCKIRDMTSTASRVFIDDQGIRYPIPPIESNVPTGCHKNKVSVPTDSTFHPGQWSLTIDIEYQVNPLRKQNYHFKTDQFTIVK